MSWCPGGNAGELIALLTDEVIPAWELEGLTPHIDDLVEIIRDQRHHRSEAVDDLVQSCSHGECGHDCPMCGGRNRRERDDLETLRQSRAADPMSTYELSEALAILASSPEASGEVGTLPPRGIAGIYVLRSDVGALLYVGIGTSVASRIKSHANDYEKRSAGWTHWECWSLPRPDREVVEGLIIAHLNPPLNKAGRTT